MVKIKDLQNILGCMETSLLMRNYTKNLTHEKIDNLIGLRLNYYRKLGQC